MAERVTMLNVLEVVDWLASSDDYPDGFVPIDRLAFELGGTTMQASVAATWAKHRGWLEARYDRPGNTFYGLTDAGLTLLEADQEPRP